MLRTLKSRTKYHACYYTKYRSLEEIQDVEDIANKVNFKEKMPPGNSNNDGVSCYANSVCQGIFCFGEVKSN